MSLFQHSVLNKYLKEANQNEIKSAYEKLKVYFHNPVIQQNIRESKEEQFQEGFLRELFVKVFGYTINPNPDYNLTTEFKNERGAKKADGAILIDSSAIAVIELKSTKTKDLESIRLQAFDYKANQQKCVYVITSNFEKVRFYINNAVDFEEFDLFKLTFEDFQLLWLCLEKENLLNGVPLAIKEASILKEENITKQIYIDYSLFKRELYSNLIKNNLELEIFNGIDEKEIKLQLFKKSQKLLDRFLFIFFGEDRGLLPPNSISRILTQWEQLKELDEYKPLYDRYKKYFNYLNTGWKGKKYEIFAYNGGLFAPDKILDSIIINDEVLQKHTKILTAYDFETDVDVNILGHIFENSLNEIEEITAQIEGAEVDSKKSKRKKDGVFYTPKYITKYIVENTVGKLCNEKKTELKIEESEYLKSRKGRPVQKLKELVKKLDTYRNWLLSLTICDPACGSGAFLNQALDFLIREHHYIDELKAKLLDVPMIFTEVENSILENNIFGVDINEESVEIAKLSLWLRTAQKGRKLTTLSNNIKCGNSLIDNPEIAGEKAFNWQNEFPEIFENGGFDIVIGNPPYVKARDNEDVKGRKYIESKYKSPYKMWDLYIPFVEKGIIISKQYGLSAMIIPDTIGKSDYTTKLIEIVETENFLYQIDFFPNIYVFENVGVRNKILFVQKLKTNQLAKRIKHYPSVFDVQNINSSNEKGNKQYLLNIAEFEIDKTNCVTLADICYVSYGMRLNSYKADPVKFKKTDLLSETKDEIHKKIYTEGKYLNRYSIDKVQYLEYDTERCPDRLVRPTFPELYPTDKLLLSRQKKVGAISFQNHYCDNTIIMAIPAIMLKSVENNSIRKYYKNINKDRVKVESISKEFDLHYILGIINSKLISYYIKYESKGKIDFYPDDWKKIPIKNNSGLSKEQIIVIVKMILDQIKSLGDLSQKFIKYLLIQFHEIEISRKLQNWHELEFADFIKELNKAIKKAGGSTLSKIDEMEWMEVFETKKAEAQKLKAEIDKTDREIDKMVYELYGLTDEEIKIVEESV